MARLAPALLTLFIAGALAACGGEDPTPTETERGDAAPTASAVRGGLLYDKWWVAAKTKQPTNTHPLWATRPDTASNTRTGATTWRCKECHGWDYRGVDGAYGKGSHKTGFAGVFGSAADAAAIRATLTGAHGYTDAQLAEIDLASLVLFLQEGLVDTTKAIDEDGAFRGDATKGKALYDKGLGGNKACKICHGPKGLKAPDSAPPGYEEWVGKIANKNPWEFLHKVRFGHPGSKMPAAHGSTASLQDLLDLSAYAQTLPREK